MFVCQQGVCKYYTVYEHGTLVRVKNCAHFPDKEHMSYVRRNKTSSKNHIECHGTAYTLYILYNHAFERLQRVAVSAHE
jgi:hypothetical protein